MSGTQIAMIIIGIILILGLIAFVINQRKSIREWLLLAVTEAEKALGSKTGRLKLRLVFENFVKLYPIISKFVSIKTFEKWVDYALVQLKELLKTNDSIKNYVDNE